MKHFNTDKYSNPKKPNKSVTFFNSINQGFYILSTFCLLLLSGCKDIVLEDFSTVDKHTFTINASLPHDDNSSTRSSASQKPDSKDIELRWQQEDKIQLFFKTESGIIKGSEAEVKNISADGKSAEFDVVVPTEIIGHFDLYGVHDAESIISVDQRSILLDAVPSPFTSLKDIRVPIFFKKENISYEGGNLDISFRHYGALQVVTLKNNTSNKITLSDNSLSIESEGKNWYHISDGLTQQPVYDMVSETISLGERVGTPLQTISFSEINATDNLKMAKWFIPNGVIPPSVHLKATINGTEQMTTTAKDARTKPFESGKAYHLYATWDGNLLEFADDASTQAYKVTMTTSKAVGSKITMLVDADIEERDDVWIDLNNNGKLDDGEEITQFGINNNYTITSQLITLYGKINKLLCNNNSLTTFDVSKSTGLRNLTCYSNYLTSLDLSSNKHLTSLICEDNQLNVLNLSGCTSLTELFTNKNSLTSLDLTSCSALKEVYCANNLLTSLQIVNCSTLTYVQCYYNDLIELDVTGCTALNSLYCGDNTIATLDLSTCTALMHLECDNNALSSLNVTGCFDLESLNCINNSLTELDVTDCIKLYDIRCYNNQIKGTEMTNLANSLNNTALPYKMFTVINKDSSLDGNICTTSDVRIALDKNWFVWDSSGYNYLGSN